jgi:hypothetical protein
VRATNHVMKSKSIVIVVVGTVRISKQQEGNPGIFGGGRDLNVQSKIRFSSPSLSK